MNCPKCKQILASNSTKCPYCGSLIHSNDDLVESLTGLLAVAGVGFLLVKGLTWIAQNIDWESLGKVVVDVLYRMALTNDLTQIHPRLKQAQSILSTGEQYTAEMSAGLACGALESALTLLIGPNSQDDPKGLADMADILYNQGRISNYDAERIKRIAVEVRNPTAHGQLIHDRNKVQDAITWISEFVSRKISIA